MALCLACMVFGADAGSGNQVAAIKAKNKDLRRADGPAKKATEIQKAKAYFGFKESTIDLNQVDLKKVVIFTVDFTGGNFQSAFMDDAYLELCNFKNAKMGSVRFQKAVINRCDFTSADLAKADFANAKLNTCNFTNAKLSGADFENATLKGVNFTGANVSAVYFTNADLAGVTFKDAVLNGSDFTKVKNYKSANWRGAKVFGVEKWAPEVKDYAMKNGAKNK